jgi:ABC-type branched-subunit amino acid transport system ATPase component
MFRTDELSVQFGAIAALREVTVDCAAHVVGIAGANGAGKSTLLNVFCGYVRPSGGHVHFRGKDCTGSGPADMARLRVGRVAQHPKLSPALTVWENASIGLRNRQAAAGLTALMDELEMSHWRDRDVSELPYSIQKLLDLVRAMAPEPDILLCDEPFSGLDAAERDRAQKVLTSVAGRGTTLVIVEHDVPRLASMVDQLIVLENGRTLGDGAPDDVLARDEVAASFIGGSVATKGVTA